eukprot:101230-Amphidinium_carterae.3
MSSTISTSPSICVGRAGADALALAVETGFVVVVLSRGFFGAGASMGGGVCTKTCAMVTSAVGGSVAGGLSACGGATSAGCN